MPAKYACVARKAVKTAIFHPIISITYCYTSDLGGENWATFASPVETCKLGGINPHAYLTDVLTRIVKRGDEDPIDDLLPYN